MLSRLALALGLASLAACAKAGPGQDQPADARPPGGTDSALPPPIDAFEPPPPDASCAPIEMELLTNGNFDTAPLGTGWTETPIVDTDELVVDSTTGIAADTAPNEAWLGGYARSGANTDAIYQDVTIPAGATALVLTGSYQIATEEDGGSFDTGSVDLASTTNTQLEAGIDLDNDDASAAWMPFSKTFSSAHAGETVRLRLTTTCDDVLRTNFFFDSLSLKATVAPQGCP